MYIRSGPWNNGGKMKSTEILMFICERSKWAITSFVPSMIWYALLWGDASPVCCSFHSFLPITTVLFAERSGILEISHRIERKLIQVKLCCATSTHANRLVCTCSFKDLSFPRSYNPYLSSCLHRSGFWAKVSIRKTHMLSAFSNELPNRVGSV